MPENSGTIAISSNGHEQVLAEIDGTHRITLCEYSVVHLVWGRDMLPFCIGDFIGMPFLLSGLEPECEMECAQGEECVHADPDDNLVHLQYGSVRIPLTVDDCHSLHDLVREAVSRLYALGHVANPRSARSQVAFPS